MAAAIDHQDQLATTSRKTYATLLCNDSYFNGVLVLIKTLRKYCSDLIPITVLVDRAQVSQATKTRLAGLCDNVIEVDTLLAATDTHTTASASTATNTTTTTSLVF